MFLSIAAWIGELWGLEVIAFGILALWYIQKRKREDRQKVPRGYGTYRIRFRS